jgi:hypothetical protein
LIKDSKIAPSRVFEEMHKKIMQHRKCSTSPTVQQKSISKPTYKKYANEIMNDVNKYHVLI